MILITITEVVATLKGYEPPVGFQIFKIEKLKDGKYEVRLKPAKA